MATELKPWSAAEGRLRQEVQVEKLAYFPKRLSASQRMNYFRYGTLQLSTVEFPMYLSFVKYSSVDTFFSQDKYEKFKSQKETFQGEGERLFGFHIVAKWQHGWKTNSRPFPSISPHCGYWKKLTFRHSKYFLQFVSPSSPFLSILLRHHFHVWEVGVAWISIIS